MSIVHVAFYPSDWLAGTRGLTASETGVYITLVARMYEMAGPIERNDDRLARLCGCTRAAFVRDLKSLMSEGKIFETEDGLFNERARKEIEKTTEISAKARAAAESRWKKKPQKNNAAKNANASAGHMPKRCQPEPEPYTQETSVSCDAGGVDFEQAIWTNGVAFLVRAGTPDRQARSIIGKWRKDYGDPDIFRAFCAANRERAVEPVSYITQVLRGPAVASKKGQEDEQIFERVVARARMANGPDYDAIGALLLPRSSGSDTGSGVD